MGAVGWIVLMLVCVGAVAEAVGPVLTSRCRIRWQPPQQYVEIGALRDLDRYEIFISTIQGQYDWKQPALVVKGRRTRARCPALVTQMDGQYYVVVIAVDQQGKASAPSNEFAFVIERQADQRPSTGPEPPAEVDEVDDPPERPDMMVAPRPWHPKYAW